MPKLSALPEDTAPTTDDYAVSTDNAGPTTKKVKWLNIITMIFASLGSWTAWSPTISGLSIGNGTIDAKFQQIGKNVNFRVLITGGTTTSLTGALDLTPPVAASADYGNLGRTPVGLCEFEDSGVQNYPGAVVLDGSGNLQPLFYNTTGTGVRWVGTSSGSPFSFGANDTVVLHGTYEAA